MGGRILTFGIFVMFATRNSFILRRKTTVAMVLAVMATPAVCTAQNSPNSLDGFVGQYQFLTKTTPVNVPGTGLRSCDRPVKDPGSLNVKGGLDPFAVSVQLGNTRNGISHGPVDGPIVPVGNGGVRLKMHNEDTTANMTMTIEGQTAVMTNRYKLDGNDGTLCDITYTWRK